MRNNSAVSMILSTRCFLGHRADTEPVIQLGMEQENFMKKLLAIIALIIVTGAQALAPAAEACTGTYAGYPCSQWNQMQDGW
jgi:hypothetical protein